MDHKITIDEDEPGYASAACPCGFMIKGGPPDAVNSAAAVHVVSAAIRQSMADWDVAIKNLNKAFASFALGFKGRDSGPPNGATQG